MPAFFCDLRPFFDPHPFFESGPFPEPHAKEHRMGPTQNPETNHTDRSAALIFTDQGAPRLIVFGQVLGVFARQYLHGGMDSLQGRTAPKLRDIAEPGS